MLVLNANNATHRYPVFSEECHFNTSNTHTQGIFTTIAKQTPNDLLVATYKCKLSLRDDHGGGGGEVTVCCSLWYRHRNVVWLYINCGRRLPTILYSYEKLRFEYILAN